MSFSTSLKVFGGTVVLSAVLASQAAAVPSTVAAEVGAQAAGAATMQAAKVNVSTRPTKEQYLRRERATLARIEQAIASNRDRLEKSYGTPELLKQTLTDVAILSLMKSIYVDADVDPALQQVGRKAARLLPILSRQGREIYASMLSEALVRSGMDAQVVVNGPEGKHLRVTSAQMSPPLVSKLQNEIGLPRQAAGLEFVKVQYTNGFEGAQSQTWVVDL